MGALLEFKDDDRERSRIKEAIENLKYLISKVPEDDVRASFQSHLAHYEAKLKRLSRPDDQAKGRP
jgi:hypothetical protein